MNYNHADLSGKMWTSTAYPKGYDAVSTSTKKDCMDVTGHGTHSSGIVAASGNNGKGVAGVNWNGRIAPCKFFKPDGTGLAADVIECLDWCVNTVGAKISSNSYSGGDNSTAFRDAIVAAGTKGHLFVASAANDGQSLDTFTTYPASFDLPNMIIVGASDPSDARCSISNYGSIVDIYAPGCGDATWTANVVSTATNTTAYKSTYEAYEGRSGTSQAVPHVAGAAALVSLHLGTTNMTTVRDRLLSTAASISTDVPKRLDLANAVKFNH